MRTAVISYHSSPLEEPGSGDAGGMTVYVRRLADALSRRGVSTDVFTRATGAGRAPIELSPGVRVVPIVAGPEAPVAKETLQSFVDEFTDGIRAFALGQRIGYDLIHTHYWQSGIAGVALRQAWDVPLVHSHHTLAEVKNRNLAPGDSPEPLTRIDGERRVIAAADVLVASTDEEQEQLACLYGASHDRVKTLHPGVDHEVFKPMDRGRARAELGLTDEAVMLFVGRLQALKGVDLAIRALAELVPALDRKALLYVVGGASGRGGQGEIERLVSLAAELEVTEHVRFVGAQPHHRLPSFYNAAELVAVCSHSESFGFAALEAHACGVPVVGTAVGGLSHIVADGHSGFLVDSRDPSVFAARSKTVLADPDLREEFSRQAVLSAARFSWDTTAELFLELYQCLVREESVEICTC